MLKTAVHEVSFGERLRAHLAIARFDHSIKNLFVLPGVIVPLSTGAATASPQLLFRLLIAFVSITLVACSNYVINEVLDAPTIDCTPSRRTGPPRVD